MNGRATRSSCGRPPCFRESSARSSRSALLELVRTVTRSTRCSLLALGGGANLLRRQPGLHVADGLPAAHFLRRRAPRARSVPLLGASHDREGEADAVVWISTFDTEHVPVRRPTCRRSCSRRPVRRVRRAVAAYFPSACPGVDHAGQILRADGVVARAAARAAGERAARCRRGPASHRGTRRRRAECRYEPDQARGRESSSIRSTAATACAATCRLPRRAHRRRSRPGRARRSEYDVAGRIVMPGGIDPHSHLAGGKVVLARTLMSDDHREHPEARTALLRGGSGLTTPSTFTTGYRYARMGYTAAFEPAMLPANARQAHAELADVPMIDKGCYALLGNDDILLADARARRGARRDRGLRRVDAAGDAGARHQVRESRRHHRLQVQRALARLRSDGAALRRHPARHRREPRHAPWPMLGARASAAPALQRSRRAGQRRDDADDDRARPERSRLHLTHLQFYGYGAEGKRSFSSGAGAHRGGGEREREHHRRRRARSCSGRPSGLRRHDGAVPHSCRRAPAQVGRHGHRRRGRLRHRAVPLPRKAASSTRCNGRSASSCSCSSKILGASSSPPTTRTARPSRPIPISSACSWIAACATSVLRDRPSAAASMSALAGLAREYCLHEIAIMTRAGPARSLGLADRGHLGAGAWPTSRSTRTARTEQAMFERADYVFKDGELVVRDGRDRRIRRGRDARLRARPSIPHRGAAAEALRGLPHRAARELQASRDDEIEGAGGRDRRARVPERSGGVTVNGVRSTTPLRKPSACARRGC